MVDLVSSDQAAPPKPGGPRSTLRIQRRIAATVVLGVFAALGVNQFALTTRYLTTIWPIA
jgi:hypothetical protein